MPQTCTVAEGQTWNNVLNYIKRNLGTKLNLLELTDEEIIIGLKEDVLRYFSQFAPRTVYKFITNAYQLNPKEGYIDWRYKIPLEEDEYLIDIVEAYGSKDTAIVDRFGGAIVSTTSAIDVVIANVYIDAVKSLNTRNTWEFIPPNTIQWEEEIETCIVVGSVIHKKLETIQPDLYETIFKPLSLAHVKIWIAALRSKYQELTTPYGNINVGWEKLDNEGRTEREKYENLLEQLPPDVLIYVDV